MKNYIVTYFTALNKSKCYITVEKYIELIKNGFVRDRIMEIRRLEAELRSKDAEVLKKALHAIATAGLFENGRKAEFFKGLTGLTVLDIDGLTDDELSDLRSRLQTDPHVLSINVSVRGHGLKVIVPYEPESGTFPATWDECKPFYTAAYKQVSEYFSRTYGCEIDPSGKDITRLNFLSYDPEPYYNPEAKAFLIKGEVEKGEVKGEKGEVKTKTKVKAKKAATAYEKRLENLTGMETISFVRRQFLFEVIINNLYRHKHRYVEGKRHNFLVLATHRLNAFGIPQEEAEILVNEHSISILKKFEENPQPVDDGELKAIVKDIYTAEKSKFASERISKPLYKEICMMVEIQRLYVVRRNILSGRVEYILRKDYEKGSYQFRELSDIVVKDLVMASIEMEQDLCETDVRNILESSFTQLYDPLRAYLDECPEWDGHDHIADFANSIEVNDQKRFRMIMKMWYVSLVQSYLNDNIVNHIMLVLYTGAQGEGKTTTLTNFLPPELRRHMFIPKSCQLKKEEFAYYIAHKLVILVDEMQKLDKEALDSIQNDITIPTVDFRMPYAHYSVNHPHIASFLGACNSTRFMNGPNGNRRNHTFEALHFNLFTPNYRQIFAQIKQLIAEGYKYYFTAEEQDELAAYSYQFEYNDDEYDMIKKYIRMYPSDYDKQEYHKSSEILEYFKHFKPEMATDRGTINRLVAGLKRKRIPSKRNHEGSKYPCYLLTAEQVEYIEQIMDTKDEYDMYYDKYVPLEILLAHREATVRDLYKADEILRNCDCDFEKAKQMYAEYLKQDKGDIAPTNETLF